MNQQAKNRTLSQRFVDWRWGKYTKLPAPRTDYTTTYDVGVPMRDGFELLANVLEPKGKASGTVLVTSPYGINMVGQAMTGGFMARRGYRVLLVKCRGTFGSGGTFEPFAQEADDAADIVAWMRERPWFDGRFATQGYSYPGFVQWALLMDPPPEMKAAVIACGPYDFSAFAHGTGAFHLSTLFEWSFVITHQEDPILRRMTAIRFSRKQIRQAMDRLPLTAADDELLHGAAPWYREWISRRDLGDPLWKNANFTPALEQVRSRYSSKAVGKTASSARPSRRTHGSPIGAPTSLSPWVHGHTPREAPRAARSSSPRPSSGWTRIWPDRAARVAPRRSTCS